MKCKFWAITSIFFRLMDTSKPSKLQFYEANLCNNLPYLNVAGSQSFHAENRIRSSNRDSIIIFWILCFLHMKGCYWCTKCFSALLWRIALLTLTTAVTKAFSQTGASSNGGIAVELQNNAISAIGTRVRLVLDGAIRPFLCHFQNPSPLSKVNRSWRLVAHSIARSLL